MSYQFELNQASRSFRFPVILMAAIVSTVIAAYSFAACSDRSDVRDGGFRLSRPPLR